METYLGTQIDKHKDGGFTISQPFLIDRILDSINGMNEANPSKSPAATTVTLTKDKDGIARKENWNYRSVIGMLNYLVNTSQPELAYAVHQCARFSNDPKHCHEQAVKRILRYLLQLKKQRNLELNFHQSYLRAWKSMWMHHLLGIGTRRGAKNRLP